MPNWNDVLEEIKRFQEANKANQEKARQAIDITRRKYLKQLHDLTGRNVIAYYSGFLSKHDISGLDINDEDKNGFMMAVHRMDRTKGLDLVLHTPGGSIAATQSIVNYLHKMFKNDIRTIVPQIAMSAGTMIACSGKSILMGSHSNLGPIDPHLRDVPCYGVIQEFRRAHREVKRDPTKALIWQTIIGQYRPTFLSQCENSIKWSNAFVLDQLKTVMFASDPAADARAARVVKVLTDYRGNKTHNRHIHIEECEAMGLQIEHLEAEGNEELQDLVLTADYHEAGGLGFCTRRAAAARLAISRRSSAVSFAARAFPRFRSPLRPGATAFGSFLGSSSGGSSLVASSTTGRQQGHRHHVGVSCLSGLA